MLSKVIVRSIIYILEWGLRYVEEKFHTIDLASLDEVAQPIKPLRTAKTVISCDYSGERALVIE